MGDVLLTTPLIRAFATQKSAEVHIITKALYHPLLADNDYITKVWKYESTSVNDLRSEKFDHLVDLQGNLRSIRLKLSLGFMSSSYKKERLATRKYLSSKDIRFQPTHVLDRYFGAASRFGVNYDEQGLDLNTDVLKGATIKETQTQKVAIVMGGTYVTKRLPKTLIGNVCSRVDYSIILLGGEDVDLIDEHYPHNVSNKVGKISIVESLQILRDVDLVVTGDTGMMHASAALHKPMIVVWGSTSPDMGFRPVYPEGKRPFYRDLFLGLSCQPCSKYGRSTCPYDHMKCLNDVQEDELIELMDEGLRDTVIQDID